MNSPQNTMRSKDWVPEFDYWAFEAVHLYGAELLFPIFFALWLLCVPLGLLKPPKRIKKWPYFAPGDYNMKKLLVVVLLLVPSFAFAEVKIAEKNRIPNDRDVGYCAWCCLETLGRHHGIKALYDLVEKRSKLSDYKEWNEKENRWDHYVWVDYGGNKQGELRNVGTYRAVTNKLRSLKVKFRSSNSRSKRLLKYAIKNDLGCVIVVLGKGVFLSGGHHAIILTEYNDKEVKFFDPNNVGHIYTASHLWLDKYWAGYTVVIEK